MKRLAVPTWREIERPAGAQSLPAWLKGLHIDWMESCANRPHVTLKTDQDLREWAGQLWSKKGSVYTAGHVDGRLVQLHHNGPLSMTDVAECVNGKWTKVHKLATTQQEGCAGSPYHIELDDGRLVVLRGPWHGSSPPGYEDVVYVNTSKNLPPPGRPWHRAGARAGLFLSHQMLVRAYATFAPHLRLAMVSRWGDREALEPIKADWDAPKHMSAEQRAGAVQGGVNV